MVLINEQPAAVSTVREQVREFVDNQGVNPELSDSPDDAIISIKTDRMTPYNIYIDMLDEVRGAYAELRDAAPLPQLGVLFGVLGQGSEQRGVIQEMCPKKVSITQPDKR